MGTTDGLPGLRRQRRRVGSASSSASDERNNEIRGVAVEVLAGSVVDGGCAVVGVVGGELHVTQRNPGVEGGHDERATKHVRVDVSETGSFADRSDPPVRSTPVESGAVTSYQDWSLAAFADGQVHGPGGSWDEEESLLVCCLSR